MALLRIPMRWRLRTLMIVVALLAVGLGTYRVLVELGPVYRLLWQLRSGNARARRKAALWIGLLGPRASFAIGALDSALDDPDQDVRANAMYSLARLGSRSPRLLPILVEQIDNTPRPERWNMQLPVTLSFDNPPTGWALSDGGLYQNDPIYALKLIRPDATAFVPLLGKALNSPHRWVRETALEALIAIVTWSDPAGKELAGALLAELAYDGPDPQTQELEAFDRFWDRKKVAEALAKLDTAAQARAVAQLAGDLSDLGSPRSYEAALLLPRLKGGKPALAASLLDFISDGDDTSRRIAMILLEPIAAPAEAPAVLRAITAPGAGRKVNLSGRLRWWESAGARQGDPGFQRFVRGTERTETTLIEPGARVLKAMGEEVERRSIGELIATVREPGADPQRRCCAIIALGEIGPDAVEAIPILEAEIRAHEAANRGASREFAASDSPGALATQALGLIAAEGNADAIASLARLVADPGASVANDASWMLLRLGPKARPAVPALVKALKDRRQVVRATSAMALGKIGGPDVRAVLPTLIVALNDENQAVEFQIIEAVAQYGAEAKAAVPRIVELLWESFHPDLAISLGRIGPDAAVAIPALLYWDIERPGWSFEIRPAMDRIMPRTAGATVAGSIAAMKAGEPTGRSRTAYDLGRLIEKPPHRPEAIAALGDALSDPDPLVRRIAAAMLGRLAPTAPGAGPLLDRAARDPDGLVRRLAAWGLSRARR